MLNILVESVVQNLHAGIIVGVLKCFKMDEPQPFNLALNEQA